MNEHKFSFTTPLNLMKKISHNLNRLIDKVNEADNCILLRPDFDEAIKAYESMQPECLDEFCANYSFGYCLLHKELDSPENREKIYLALKKYIIQHQKAS